MDLHPIITSSTKTRALWRVLFHWLKSTNNLKLMPRVISGMQTDSIKASLLDNSNDFKELIQLSSYNYAGLNGHPDIIAAAKIALEAYGASTSGVRLLNGNLDLHIELESLLSKFLGTEDSVIYSSGYAANLAAIATICNEDDIIFSDELNHQSIVEGIKLSRSKMIKFAHSDLNQLESLIKQYSLNDRKFIVSDGVFSMDGDICNLLGIMDIGKKYNAFVIIDDAHAIGAIGKYGKGTSEYFNLKTMPDIVTGSFSKGLPGMGGYIAGEKNLMDLFRYGSNPYIFSASLPASVTAGLIKAIDILSSSHSLMDKLRSNELLLRKGLTEIGLNTMNSNSPIIPILLKSRIETFQFAEMLHSKNIFVNPIIFPAVPINLPRVRLNASASLSETQIFEALNQIQNASQNLNLI